MRSCSIWAAALCSSAIWLRTARVLRSRAARHSRCVASCSASCCELRATASAIHVFRSPICTSSPGSINGERAILARLSRRLELLSTNLRATKLGEEALPPGLRGDEPHLGGLIVVGVSGMWFGYMYRTPTRLGIAVNEGIFATSMRGLCFRQHEVLFSSSVGVDDIWCDVNEREFLFFFWQFLCSPSACGLRSISLLL